MGMPRTLLGLIVATLVSGCGYEHFGRREANPAAGGDAALAAAYSNLSTEYKILKQELALARKEGDALRAAVDRGGAVSSVEAAARLNETTRELAALRVSYAKLQAERAAGAAVGVTAKSASSALHPTELQAENTRLRGEIERARGENLALADRLKQATTRFEQAQQELAQLNTELLAVKQARGRAEQVADSLRTQLAVVVAPDSGAGRAAAGSGGTKESASGGLAALQLARAPTADAIPTAELRTDTERLRRASAAASANPPPASGARIHVVQPGETLETIALRYYGSAERWRAIHEANPALLGGGQRLRAGMELKLP
ncbi:MAG: LysM peptidoglycan-binding domain-containing protein [Verrucomicrobia bacterium]|nr:LysM peptidoglycan-binding domain-containing protein [Verrucomicrobiota bacterium]